MSNVVCTKCGVTGDGKCPWCRNVFCDDGWDAVSSHRIKVPMVGGKEEIKIVRFPGETAAEALAHVREILLHLDPKIAVCVHRWRFAPGAKSEIGCGHQNEEEMLKEGM